MTLNSLGRRVQRLPESIGPEEFFEAGNSGILAVSMAASIVERDAAGGGWHKPDISPKRVPNPTVSLFGLDSYSTESINDTVEAEYGGEAESLRRLSKTLDSILSKVIARHERIVFEIAGPPRKSVWGPNVVWLSA